MHIVVKLWEIPDDGLTENITEPIVDMIYHQKRVGLIEWHPTASNILISSGKLCLCLALHLDFERTVQLLNLLLSIGLCLKLEKPL